MSDRLVTVTGASGFVGSMVVAELVRAGTKVRAVARRPLTLAGATSVVVSDYRDLEPCSAADILVHLAETASVTETDRMGAQFVNDSRATVEALSAKSWSRIVYGSSAVIYGDDTSRPRRPDEMVAPESVYGRAKVACEAIALSASGVVARLSNVYGRQMARGTVLTDILDQIPSQGPVTVRDMSPVRDFLHISDAARGLIALTAAPGRRIYNLGSGVGTPVGELARLMLDLSGQGERTVVATAPAARASHLVLDIEQTTAEAGWTPRVTLTEGLFDLVRVAA